MENIVYNVFNSSSRKLRLFLSLAFVTCCAACSKEVADLKPKNGNIAYANFVHAGEAFLYGGNENLNWGNQLYINDSINNAPFDSYNNGQYPFVFKFEPANRNYISRLPLSFTNSIGGLVIDNVSADVYWLGLEAGNYKFIYTSKDKTYLQTAELPLQKQTYNIFYLVESPESDAAYTVVHTPIIRPDKKEGIIGVQLVNLSPDAGDISVSQIDALGNEINTSLPKKLKFGENNYTELSLKGTEATYGRVLLSVKTEDAKGYMPISIPATDGSIYSVMLRGFNKQTVRKVKKDNSNYVSVTVMPNFRSSIRRVFY